MTSDLMTFARPFGAAGVAVNPSTPDCHWKVVWCWNIEGFVSHGLNHGFPSARSRKSIGRQEEKQSSQFCSSEGIAY